MLLKWTRMLKFSFVVGENVSEKNRKFVSCAQWERCLAWHSSSLLKVRMSLSNENPRPCEFF